MNNLPIDVMHELGMAGTLIGVNVMPLQDLVKDYRFGDAISGPRAVLGMLNPWDNTTAPLIYETLIRVMALHEAHQEEAKRRLADIYITPAVEKYNLLDFGSYEPIIEAGYCSAQEALALWSGRTTVSGFKTPARKLEHLLVDLECLIDAFQKKG